MEREQPEPKDTRITDSRADFEELSKEAVENDKKAWEIHKSFGPQPK